MRKKQYGMSKVDACPFCGKQSTTKNKQGLYVCADHKDTLLEDIKCTCGTYLDLKSGKWGPYFNCMNCGNVNFNKGMEMKNITQKFKTQSPSSSSSKPKQIKQKVRKKTKDKFILDSGNYPDFDYGL